jgi:lipopolysaccharide assembly outer membrane protein LptD (OstA)
MLRQLLASWLLFVLTAGSARRRSRHRRQSRTRRKRRRASRLDSSKLPESVRGRQKRGSEPNAVVYEGDVTCQLPDGAVVYGDVIKFIQETDGARIEGRGQRRLFRTGGHISAERMEYHTATGTGVFEIAHGALALGPNVDRRQFGGQTPEVEFYGTRLEKIGHRRFRVTNGGWTTCLQPTPRWDFTTSSMVLELDHYVTARNTVLRVKGVPLFWLPFLYYPIQKDDRATGFLMPTYGTSTFRGPTLSNAFFWAIDRSQDATFLYDWFSRAGQGAGTEYRYVASPQSSGTVRFYRLNRAQTTFTEDGTTSIPGAHRPVTRSTHRPCRWSRPGSSPAPASTTLRTSSVSSCCTRRSPRRPTAIASSKAA